jgi:hypothetical protein
LYSTKTQAVLVLPRPVLVARVILEGLAASWKLSMPCSHFSYPTAAHSRHGRIKRGAITTKLADTVKSRDNAAIKTCIIFIVMTVSAVAANAEDRPSWVKVNGGTYGAKADDRGPIGGGAGYTRTVTKGDFTATTAQTSPARRSKSTTTLSAPHRHRLSSEASHRKSAMFTITGLFGTTNLLTRCMPKPRPRFLIMHTPTRRT